MTRPTAESPATEAGQALLESLGSDWLHWVDQAGRDAVATTIRRIEAEAAALSDSARLREALLSRIVDIRWAGTRDPSDYWRGFNDALDKCETEIDAALLAQPTQAAER